MQFTLDDIDVVQKRIKVEVPAEVVSQELDRSYAKLSKKVKIDGFRPGKVPRSVLERYYKEDAEREAIEKIVEKTLDDAIEQANVVLILPPYVEEVSQVTSGQSFTYSALLDLWPEFEVPQYKALELIRPSVKVTDEEVDEQIEALRSHYATIEKCDEDRPVQDDDIAVVDYYGTVHGETEKIIEEQGHYLQIGKKSFAKEFEDALVGMKIGDEKQVTIDYPEDALNAKFAGKKIDYAVSLKDIKKRVLPALTDEFAKTVSPVYPTIADVRHKLRRQIEMDKEDAALRSLNMQIVDNLLKHADFPVPQRLLDNKIQQIVDNFKGYLSERGVTFETAGISEDKFKAKVVEDALKQVRTEILLDKIVELEGIALDEEDVNSYIKANPSLAQLDRKQLHEVVETLVLPKLRTQKVLDFILSKAEVKTEE